MILAVDSSTGTSAAVVDDGRIVSEAHDDDTRRHTEVVGTLLHRVLVEAGIGPERLDAIAAGIGPGPFTGLRVGLAAAEAMGAALGIPVLGVVSPDAVAWERLRRAASAERPFAVVTDARRRQIHVTRYGGRDADGLPRRLGDPVLRAATSAPLPEDGEWLRAARIPSGALGLLAERRRELGIGCPAPRPLYLRAPDVMPPSSPKTVLQ